MRVGVALGAGILVATALSGCGEAPVVRIVDGRAQAGRFISEAAYALYARGAEAEAAGDPARALRAFDMAAAEDPESPEIWTRIGALRCALRPTDDGRAFAEEAFARAEAVDPKYGPAHRERARCAFGGPVDGLYRARAEAQQALALDPDDLATVLVHAEALERIEPRDAARRAYVAAALRRRADGEAWAALLAFARRKGDAALVLWASEHLATLSPPLAPSTDAASPRAPASPAIVDAPLVAGDLAEALRRARKARLRTGELAVRAAALGRVPFAREQASLALGADPADTDARIALAAAADLGGDLAQLDAAMRGIPRRTTRPSPLARLLFAEVLARRAGTDAARAWLGEQRMPPASGDDALLEAAERRLGEALSREAPAQTAPR